MTVDVDSYREQVRAFIIERGPRLRREGVRVPVDADEERLLPGRDVEAGSPLGGERRVEHRSEGLRELDEVPLGQGEAAAHGGSLAARAALRTDVPPGTIPASEAGDNGHPPSLENPP